MRRIITITRAATEPTWSFHEYVADNTTLFGNPNRGFWVQEVNSTDLTALPTVPVAHYTVVRKCFRLDAYRTTATLPPQVALDIQAFFDELRDRGQKVIPRFGYNWSGSGLDATLTIVNGHIDQLAAVINANADLIVAVEAGFSGYWNEMHHSSNNLVGGTDPTGYIAVDGASAVNADTLSYVNNILSSWNVDFVLARLTRQADALIANSISAHATPVNASTAFDGSRTARVGMYNDFFLNEPHDGLWVPFNTGPTNSNHTTPVSGPRLAMYVFAAAQTEYTYMEGEPDPGQPIDWAYTPERTIADLEDYHWDSVHSKVHPASPTGDGGNPSVQESWIADGIWNEIGRNLGYRLYLIDATIPDQATAGGTIEFTLAFGNAGYSRVKHDRDANLVLVPTGGGTDVVVEIPRTEFDIREIPSGSGETQYPIALTLPSGLSGSYALHLELPDPSSRLASDPAYSIRLANTGMWNSTTGRHDLGHTVTVA